MKKSKVIKIGISSAVLLASLTVAVPLIATSCSKPNEGNETRGSKVVALHNQYVANEAKFLEANSANLPKLENGSLDKSLNGIIENAEAAIKALTEYSTTNLDEQIWKDSYIFQWKNKIENIKSGMIFLGANPITGSRVLGTSANHIADTIKAKTNIYQINEETGDPDSSKVDENLIKNLPNAIDEAIQIIDWYQQVLKIGEDYGYMPSTIHKKLFINQMISTFYDSEASKMLGLSDNNIKLTEIFTYTGKSIFDYFKNILKASIKSGGNKEELTEKFTSLQKTLNEFMNWYSTEYYQNKNSFPNTISTDQIELSKTNTNKEVERSIIFTDGTTGYGLGLTKADLDAKEIGIGYMNLDTAKLSNTIFKDYTNPNKLYQQLLNNNNSITTSAEDIYQLGIELTNQAKTNMLAIANEANVILSTPFATSEIYYDPDGLGPEVRALKKISEEQGDDFKKFNLWLNQEDFFFGREYLDGEGLTNYIDYYWAKPTDDKIANYKETIIKQGYEKPWQNANTINGQDTGTVTGNQALAGAVLSLQGYMEFKTATDNLFNSMFNEIPDYTLSPYNYSIREFIGVGMEGPRGSNQFQYNCDPYYSLPKWSVSTLTNHEGKMGHHTQNAYWTAYLPGGDGTDGTGPGYTFVNDAFHEGWAVFAEWYGNQLGLYGSDLDDNSKPTNWKNAKGAIPSYNENNIEELTKTMKALHGGVYYNKVKGEDNSAEKVQNSIELANMLQYYGFLNEAQLRNMRLALDVAIHFNPNKATSSTKVASPELPYGSSLTQVRDFMKNNSALSIGDIGSESIRYAVIPSQATGYMLGKQIFQNLYKAVETKLGVNLATDSLQSKKLFDLMLKNGEIPLAVLEQVIKQQYEITVSENTK